MVPNHALIILALLYGDDDFQKSLMIVNTCGWDTDCNSGNVGCLLGIKNGLAGIDGGPDWRGPVADRMYLATADGGRGITDAVAETIHIVNSGRALAGAAAHRAQGRRPLPLRSARRRPGLHARRQPRGARRRHRRKRGRPQPGRCPQPGPALREPGPRPLRPGRHPDLHPVAPGVRLFRQARLQPLCLAHPLRRPDPGGGAVGGRSQRRARVRRPVHFRL